MRSINLLLFILCFCSVGLVAWFLINNSMKSNDKSAPRASQPLPTVMTDTTTSSTIPTITIKDVTLRETEKHKEYELVVTAQESRFHHVSDVVECCNVLCKINKKGTP